MNVHLDDHDVLETLTMMRPDSSDLGQEWYPGRLGELPAETTGRWPAGGDRFRRDRPFRQ